jgi:hypothetical protein
MTVNSAENDDEDTTTLATTEDLEDGDFTSNEEHDKYGEV